MSPESFVAILDRLDLTQGDVARFLDVDARNPRRWAQEGGDGPPRSVALVLVLLERFNLSPGEALALLDAAP
jgi:hypothetical protein